MIKEKRHQLILDLIDKNEIVRVHDLVDELKVTDMTIRRDLQELENDQKLIRIHGGARKLQKETIPFLELNHIEKREMQTVEKQEIANKIANDINDHEIIFLGSGTTLELVYDYLDHINHLKVITNSIHIFNRFKHDDRFELILIGGTYRSQTGSFTGTIANDLVENIYVQKAFIGVNAINLNQVFNANEDEGVLQRTIFNNAHKSYIVADSSKFNKMDFYQFYDLDQVDYLVSENEIDAEVKKTYSTLVKII